MSIETVTQPVEYPCAVCGKRFPTRAGVTGHQFAHRGPEPCPECGERFKPGISMARHRENIHGVISEREQQRRRKADIPVPAPVSVPVADLDWKADEIFQSVINVLWPSGMIPAHAILPLVQWREDTQVFLEKIR